MRSILICAAFLGLGMTLFAGEAVETYAAAKAKYEQEAADLEKKIAEAEKKGGSADELKDELGWLIANQSVLAMVESFKVGPRPDPQPPGPPEAPPPEPSVPGLTPPPAETQ